MAKQRGRRDTGAEGSLFDAVADAQQPAHPSAQRGARRAVTAADLQRPVRLRRPREPELAAADIVAANQLDIFADPVEIHDLTPRLPAAARARVKGVWSVRLSRTSPAHRVFHDRHGWYCEEHGSECPAVRTARERA